MFAVSMLCNNFLCKEHGGSTAVMVLGCMMKRHYCEDAPCARDNQQ